MLSTTISYTQQFVSERDHETFEGFVRVKSKEKVVEWMVTGEIYGDLFLKIRSLRISSRDIQRIVHDSSDDFNAYLSHRFKPLTRNRVKPLRPGELLEVPALKLYESLTYLKVEKVKHLVNPKFPWMIAAPDGMVVCGDIFYKGIEIKSTQQKSNTNYTYLCNASVYKSKGSWLMNTKSEAYCQIQMCMAVSNLRKWDLVIYFSDNTICIIPVTWDEKFINKYVKLASEKYFQHYLPRLSRALVM